jgi:hypothetical protein
LDYILGHFRIYIHAGLRKLIIVPNPYWHRGLRSAVTNITFEDMKAEEILKFSVGEIQLVRDLKTYVEKCYRDKPRLHVHVAEIFFIKDRRLSKHNDGEVEVKVEEVVDTR